MSSGDKFGFWRKRKPEEPEKTEVTEPVATQPAQSEVQVTTPENRPAEIKLSGEVDVNVNVRQPDVPTAPTVSDESIENRTPENMFKTLRYQESGLDEVQVIRVLCYDPENGGRRTNVADVRRKYGRRLDLGSRHEPWCNGVKVADNYEPAAGSELCWKEDAKGRQS